jgi:hypothetical protein
LCPLTFSIALVIVQPLPAPLAPSPLPTRKPPALFAPHPRPVPPGRLTRSSNGCIIIPALGGNTGVGDGDAAERTSPSVRDDALGAAGGKGGRRDARGRISSRGGAVVVPRTMWGDGGREGVIPLQGNPPRTTHRRRIISIVRAGAEPHARLFHEPAPFGSSLPGRLTRSFNGLTILLRPATMWAWTTAARLRDDARRRQAGGGM